VPYQPTPSLRRPTNGQAPRWSDAAQAYLPATIGTMADQDSSAVAITGGTINGTAIGGTVPAAGAFTTLATTSTALVANLNADRLDSQEGAYYTGFATDAAASALSAAEGYTDAAIVALNLGTISTQDADAVAITGGAIDGTIIGALTKAAGSFTTVAAVVSDAATNTVPTVATFSHATSNTAANGFGAAVMIQAETDSGDMRNAGGLSAEWIDATDASRRAIVRHFGFEAGAGQVEYLTFASDGAGRGTISGNYEWLFTSDHIGADSTTGAVVIGGSLGAVQIRTSGPIYNGDSTYLMRATTTLPDGAAGFTGTLTNAPAAGNPTKWIKVDDNGTLRHIPAW
jgi:hypothetical protein